LIGFIVLIIVAWANMADKLYPDDYIPFSERRYCGYCFQDVTKIAKPGEEFICPHCKRKVIYYA
jgi:hypothetical protein